MDENNIIQRGELVKFKVTSNRPDFDMETMDYYVELHYGMMGKMLTIQKSEFLYGTGGEYVMQFSTADMVGKVTARMVMHILDTDISSNYREEVDEQVICFVVDNPCPRFLACPCGSGSHDVNYERTEESDIAAMYMRLVVAEIVTPESGQGEPYTIYRPLITINDEYIYVLRTILENNN